MRKKLLIFFSFITFVLTSYSQPILKDRVALVIGAQSYQHVAPLRNALNDARDVARSLKEKDFDVIELYDPKSKREMQEAIRKYFSSISGQKQMVGLFYYSGHGMQVDGSNYLIPTAANPQLKADLDDQCLKMDFIMHALEEAGNPLNIIILDACRNNPFRSFTRSGEKGLNMVDAPKGSYIVYATKPGSVASDGSGNNGLFTSKLLKYINEPELSIEQVFKRVARDVSEESGEMQRPWIASDYTGDFYFSNETQNSTQSQSLTLSKPSTSEINTSRSTTKLSAEESYQKGFSLFTSNDLEGSVEHFLNAATQGNSLSQFYLGKIFLNDKYSGKDNEKAFFWITKAANQNVTEAQFILGNLFYYGEGTSENFQQALKWYEESAKANNKEAQYALATMLMNGRGTQKNEPSAIEWLKKAALNGHLESQNKLGELFLMGGNTISKNKSEAIKWFKMAAAQGSNMAKETLSSLGVKN
jgi:uncharacterized caspase-like protein